MTLRDILFLVWGAALMAILVGFITIIDDYNDETPEPIPGIEMIEVPLRSKWLYVGDLNPNDPNPFKRHYYKKELGRRMGDIFYRVTVIDKLEDWIQIHKDDLRRKPFGLVDSFDKEFFLRNYIPYVETTAKKSN